MSDGYTKFDAALAVLLCSTDEIARTRAVADILAMRREEAKRDALVPPGHPRIWDGTVRVGRGAPLASMSNEAFVRQQAEVQRGDGDDTGNPWKQEMEALRERAEKAEKEVRAGKEQRTLTESEFDDLARGAWAALSTYPGEFVASRHAMFRWLEEKGYLSVRLPPQNQS